MLTLRYWVAALALLAGAAHADTLVTDNFTVEVRNNCAEGEVICDNVSYHAVSHKSGEELRLRGSTLARMCADGVTPCQFLGYQFKNGNTTYRLLDIGDRGRLQVEQAGKLLLDEEGRWLYR